MSRKGGDGPETVDKWGKAVDKGLETGITLDGWGIADRHICGYQTGRAHIYRNNEKMS